MGDPDNIKWEDYPPIVKFYCIILTIAFAVTVISWIAFAVGKI